LATTLASEQGRWVLQDRPSAASELAIEFTSSKTVSKRIVDRTFIEGDVRWIIDYKSVELDDNTSASALLAIAKQYQAQLAEYAQLFKHEGLPVKQAIFFSSIGQLIELSSAN